MLEILRRGRGTCCAAALILAAWARAVSPIEAQEPKPAAAGEQKKDRGDIELALRLRYEDVAQDSLAAGARASTLRTALAYGTPAWRGFAGRVEFENVRNIGYADDHANGGAGALGNGVTGRPVIADPEVTEVNQAYLRYHRGKQFTVDAGRLELVVADERFVGPVAFRQNHQSLDGARVSVTAIPRATLLLGYIQNVNRINGADEGMDSFLLDAPIDLGKCGKLAPYVLRLDYDSPASAALSSATYGARWDGRVPAGKTWSIPIHAEAALQRDTANNPADVDTQYWRLEAGLAREKLSFGLGYEVLGSDAGLGAFQTPLATLHRFNGWADLFLTTPPDGLVDAYATVAGKVGALSWSAAYHDFGADHGPASYGTEFDAEVAWKAPWKQSFSLTYAMYGADDLASDTDKFWITTSYKFGAKI